MFGIGVVALALSTAQVLRAQSPESQEESDHVAYEIVVAGTHASPPTVAQIHKIFAEQGAKGREFKGNFGARLNDKRKPGPDNMANVLIFEHD